MTNVPTNRLDRRHSTRQRLRAYPKWQSVARSLFCQHALFFRRFQQLSADESITIDFDLLGQPTSSSAQGASKGYFADDKNRYGRQLARISVADTSEILADELYDGNQASCTVFKELGQKMEHALALDEKANRKRIRLRLDGGFGTDSHINFARSRGYQLLVKMYSGNRARVLCQSVEKWVAAPTVCQRRNGENATREAAWVKSPHRYGRKTRQIAIRTQNRKAKAGYSYRILVTTDLDSSVQSVLDDYDARAGVPESRFCCDNQGLAARKRRKQRFIAQQMLMWLTRIAHNLIVWIKQWIIDAPDWVEQAEQWIEQIKRQWKMETVSTEQWVADTKKMLQKRGIKRFTHQLLALSRTLTFKRGKRSRVRLKTGYPIIERIALAWVAILHNTGVEITFAPT